MKKLVVRPSIVDGMMTIKQLPAVVVCKRDKARPLTAFAFRSRPLPALIGGIPWDIGEEHQAFIFAELDPGTYQLVICDATPPCPALQMVRMRVRKKALRALAGGPVVITSPLSNSTVNTTVPAMGKSLIDNPANVRIDMHCNNGHVFPPGGNAPPDSTIGDFWFITININENPLHNPFRIDAHDSLGNSDQQNNITVVSAMGPVPLAPPPQKGRGRQKRRKVK